MKNLAVTINLPCLKLNIPENSINFHYLERIIFNLTRKIGQELLEELLQIIDDGLMAERERGSLSNQGKRLRYMTTLLGDITFYKRLYQDRGRKYRYLLDEKLGLTKNQRVSKAYQKIEGLLAFVSGSYRTDSRIVYLEVDGTNIHLQHEEKKRTELKLGIISKGKERSGVNPSG